jgi:hypothetical protein
MIHPVLHTYIRDYWSDPLGENAFLGILSGKEAGNDLGLCLVKGH